MSIEQSINIAARIIPINWPLKSMIAVNPLWDLQEMPFIKAIEHTKQYIDIKGCLAYDEYIKLYHLGLITSVDLTLALREYGAEGDISDNHIQLFFSKEVIEYYRASDRSNRLYSLPDYAFKNQLLEFISGYFDCNQYVWHQNDSKYPFFASWRMHATVENKLWGEWLYDLPEDINQALELILLKLKISPEEVVSFFSWILSQLIGWSSLIKWLDSRPNNQLIEQKASLAELLLIWCCLLISEKSFDFQSLKNKKFEKIKLSAVNSTMVHDETIPSVIKEMFVEDLCLIWQRAYELHQHNMLLSKLKHKKIGAIDNQRIPTAQFVFCIDTRSEGIRRYLEKNGKYETFGFAGFFGSLFSLKDSDSEEISLQSPALVDPTIEVNVKKTVGSSSSKLSKIFKNVSLGFKNNFFSPFAFFEIIGNVMTLPLLGKTFAPAQYEHVVVGNGSACCEKKFDNPFLMTNRIKDAVDSLYYFLKTINLTDNMASIVFICGHQAQTENNPFQASFDCGACGGNSGAINAEVTCEILNNLQARELLIERGVRFGLNTTFIPAYHNTTTDEFIINSQYISKIPIYDQLKTDIEDALKALKAERMKDLPAINNANDRHIHWAELIPEWGLANNMAMIIGPRDYTRQIDLGRRVFLHSYDSKQDTDGTLLSAIITAPMVVAHWINSQYYFSSTDPDVYGSGNKAIHNVVGQCGVMEGNLSDLKIGLPMQSVIYKDRLVHQPIRLLVIIIAPRDLVTSVLNKHSNIKALFDNQWLSLNIIEPESMHDI